MRYLKFIGLVLVIIVLVIGVAITIQSIKNGQQQAASVYQVPTAVDRHIGGSIPFGGVPNHVPGLVACSQDPMLTVTSPNGGQVYHRGQTITVSWSTCNIPTTAGINIFLQTPDALVGLNTTSSLATMTGKLIPNSVNSATVTLPMATSSYTTTGSQFKILVTALEPVTSGTGFTSVGLDYSDNFFTINP